MRPHVDATLFQDSFTIPSVEPGISTTERSHTLTPYPSDRSLVSTAFETLYQRELHPWGASMHTCSLELPAEIGGFLGGVDDRDMAPQRPSLCARVMLAGRMDNMDTVVQRW